MIRILNSSVHSRYNDYEHGEIHLTLSFLGDGSLQEIVIVGDGFFISRDAWREACHEKIPPQKELDLCQGYYSDKDPKIRKFLERVLYESKYYF